MKRQTTAVLPARIILAFLVCCVVSGDLMVAADQAPFKFTADSVNQAVTVVGRLEFVGRNYFLDPRFVIVDEQNNRVPVTPWAPLEVAPTPPGAPHSGSRPRTMQDYLHRQFSIKGVHRRAVMSPGQPSLPGTPGDDYLEVQSVTDTTTHTSIFNAIAMSPVNRAPDANTGPASGRQPAEGQKPNDPKPSKRDK